MKNPFSFGRNVCGKTIAGRNEQVLQVLEVIRNRGRLFMTGHRRMGKSSVLNAALLDLPRLSATAVFVDAEMFSTFESITREIIRQTAVFIGKDLAETDKRVRQCFAQLHPVLEYCVRADGSYWNVDIRPTRAKGLTVFLQALDGLDLFAQSRKGPVAIIIDEFQRVLQLGGFNSEGQIRSAVQQHHGLGYIFAGSDVIQFTRMCTSHSRPFYRSGSVLFVGPISRADFVPFLVERFGEAGVRVSEHAGHRILDLSRDVPYNVQMLAHACCSRLAREQRKRGKPVSLTPELVDGTLADLVRGLDCFYVSTWNELTSIQQQTLVAVIENGGKNLQSTAISQRIGHGPASIRRSLQSAVAKGILLPISLRTGNPVLFLDPFQEDWIKRFVLPYR